MEANTADELRTAIRVVENVMCKPNGSLHLYDKLRAELAALEEASQPDLISKADVLGKLDKIRAFVWKVRASEAETDLVDMMIREISSMNQPEQQAPDAPTCQTCGGSGCVTTYKNTPGTSFDIESVLCPDCHDAQPAVVQPDTVSRADWEDAQNQIARLSRELSSGKLISRRAVVDRLRKCLTKVIVVPANMDSSQIFKIIDPFHKLMNDLEAGNV